MKKFAKVCAIAGLILFVLGGGITAGAAAMGADWQGIYRAMRDTDDYKRAADRDWLEDVPDFPESVDSEVELTYSGVEELDIEMNAGFVSVETGGADPVITVIYEEGRNCYNTYMDESTLKVECRKLSEGKNWGSEKSASRKLRILVPEGYRFNRVEAEVNAGAIRMGSVQAEVMGVEVKAGSIDITQSKVSKLNVDCKAGSAAYQGSLSGDADLECKSGSVRLNLDGAKKDYNYSMESTMGKISIGQESFSGAFYNKTMDHGADYNMKLDNGMGEIKISFKQ